MKINVNRKKTRKISEKQANSFYEKYNKKLDKLEAKGIKLLRLNKNAVVNAIRQERKELSKKGRYASDIVQNIVNSELYEDKFRRNEAISLRKALGIDIKIADIQSADRNAFLEMHRDELKKFYDGIKGNPKAIREWNEKLGTNYSNAKEIMSNYFFGSK